MGRGDARTWRCSCSRERFVDGKPIEIFNHGHHKRDFTYIDDIVEGVVRTLDRVPRADPAWDSAQADPASSAAPYRLYNIGSNRPIDLLRYVELLEEALGRRVEKIMRPCSPGTSRIPSPT